MPSRKNVNPMDIPHLLSSLWMADVLPEDPPKFKARLFGTELVNAFQLEPTALCLDELGFTGNIIKRMTNLLETRTPYYWQGKFPIESEDFNYYSTVTLPLSSDNKNVNIILSGVHCFA